MYLGGYRALPGYFPPQNTVTKLSYSRTILFPKWVVMSIFVVAKPLGDLPVFGVRENWDLRETSNSAKNWEKTRFYLNQTSYDFGRWNSQKNAKFAKFAHSSRSFPKFAELRCRVIKQAINSVGYLIRFELWFQSTDRLIRTDSTATPVGFL